MQIEVVLQLHVHRNGLAVTGCGHKSDLPRCGDRFLSQAALKRLHCANVCYLAGARKHYAQDNGSRNVVLARLFRVLRFRLEEHARALAYVWGAVNAISLVWIWIISLAPAYSAITVLIRTAAHVAVAAAPESRAVAFPYACTFPWAHATAVAPSVGRSRRSG